MTFSEQEIFEKNFDYVRSRIEPYLQNNFVDRAAHSLEDIEAEQARLRQRASQKEQAMSLLRSVFSLLGFDLAGKPEQIEILLQYILDNCHSQVFLNEKISPYVVKVLDR